jgi:hypothetical protein
MKQSERENIDEKINEGLESRNKEPVQHFVKTKRIFTQHTASTISNRVAVDPEVEFLEQWIF